MEMDSKTLATRQQAHHCQDKRTRGNAVLPLCMQAVCKHSKDSLTPAGPSCITQQEQIKAAASHSQRGDTEYSVSSHRDPTWLEIRDDEAGLLFAIPHCYKQPYDSMKRVCHGRGRRGGSNGFLEQCMKDTAPAMAARMQRRQCLQSPAVVQRAACNP
ncbi:hypothetical protein E2C01_035603 [Portunus trituberculatus]|uniref:Uncharacterized protein n=1 Tax=Portunus trituberculatus TaxID=210409 RepID=A0A5B7F4M1_PORTR|nr:hypothetical protein [Portunus trituberculatus]